MGYRYPTSRCRSLPELEDRVRELVRQLEPVILENRIVETTETVVAHGLGEVPGWVGWDPPHCIAIVKQTKPPDKRNVYLQATIRCVVNVRVLRAGPLLPGQMPNGGYHLADWDPGGADNDHLVKSSLTDATTVGGLVEKTEAGSNVTLTEVTTGGQKKLRISSTDTVTPLGDADPLPNGVADPGVSDYGAHQDHVHPAATHAPVVALCGSDEGDAFVSWTPGPAGTGTWTRNFNGTFSVSAWSDYASVVNGDRIFVISVFGVTEATELSYQYAGIFDVVDVGTPSTPAVVRRSSDADTSAEFTAGMSVEVIRGASWAGKTLFLLTWPIVLDTTVQRWGISPTGSAAHTHAWSDLRPEGMANYPMPMLTVEAGGKLTLGAGNFFAVYPDGNDLTQISVPSFPAYTTIPLRLVFTAPVRIQHQATPDPNFGTLYLHRNGSVNNPLTFKYDWSTADFVFVGGQWLLCSYHSTQ